MTSVSRETYEKLRAYEELLLKWNDKINLVSASTLPDFWERHIEDSLQLSSVADAPSGIWMDLGSGGGLPGIPLAILHRENRKLSFSLVESDQRKCAFLRTAVRELGLNVEVLSKRIESLPDIEVQHLSARALAPLNVLLDYSSKLINSTTGVCYFLKGRSWEDEVEKARETFSFSLEVFDSVTQEGSAILKIGDLNRA